MILTSKSAGVKEARTGRLKRGSIDLLAL